MNKSEALHLIKNNPVFWSRLGFCYDPPLKNEKGAPLCFVEDLSTFGNYHRAFTAHGVKIHTCILHSGWVGVDEYDYSLTDRVLEEVFKDDPDIYFIPRIKVNVPVSWCEQNPEEVFCYYGAPETAEGVRALVGTLRQDYLGYEAPKGYAYCTTAGSFIDPRPNVGGIISLQSFSSEKWLADATVALERVIDRIEKSKYADRIIGYHIGYGACGEAVLWGRTSNHYGDYGIGHKRRFYDYGIKKYGSREKLAEAWGQPDIQRDNVRLPSPEERYAQTATVEDFFRKDACHAISTDLDCFVSEVNTDAILHFGKVVKEKTGDKPVGSFYGYFMHIDNAAYTGHLAIDKLLNSPYIDFLAAPKSYYRNGVGEPGGTLSATKSINRKKIWLDELDNGTHLSSEFIKGEFESFAETQTIYWRELAKNLSDGSGFWWMDLCGGWFDDEETLGELSRLVRASDRVRGKTPIGQSDVLMIVDDACALQMNISRELRLGFMEDFLCELRMTGCLTDVYRLCDLGTLDLSKYKLIVFAYTFKINEETRRLIAEIPADKTIMFNYAAGVISDSGVSLENVTRLTGATLAPLAEDSSFPALQIVKGAGVDVIACDGDAVRVGRVKRANGGVNIVNVKPFMSVSELRKIADEAGCHAYAPAGNTVYGDDRFLGIFPSEEGTLEICLKETGDYENLVTGDVFKNTDKISVAASATTPLFLMKGK